MNKASVLLVCDGPAERLHLGGWLEEAGFLVSSCPGPQGADYVCLGGRRLPCPLADAVDIVVLDMHLASDEMLRGTPGWDLMLYYMAQGKKVVALSGLEDPVRPRSDEGVTVLERPAARDELIAAVRAFAHATPAGTSGASWRTS